MLSSVLLASVLSSWLSSGQNIVTKPDFVIKEPDKCPHVIGESRSNLLRTLIASFSSSGKLFTQSRVTGGTNDTDVKHHIVKEVSDVSTCVDACCQDPRCHVAMLNSSTCHLVSCDQDSFCLPVSLPPDSGDNSSLVLVRSASGGAWPGASVTSLASSTLSSARVCEVGLGAEQCASGEVCQPQHDKSRNGLCECEEGRVRDQGTCVIPALPVSTPSSLPVNISVLVENKTLTLPQTSVSLTVLTSPEQSDSNPYKFEWRNIAMPPKGDTAVEENANSRTLSLSSLVEGVYQWRVIVTSSSPAGYGEAAANVTVLPAARVNRPPKAIIAPLNQTVTLPTNKAIVDGSGSTDDTPLKSWLWELVSGPVGYQQELDAQSIITLSDLTAGNYTVKLTVTDEDGEADSTTATIEVVKDKDYPPKAVAGEDIVIYLPVNNATLNGNQSTDDHGIVTWEWTKVKAEGEADLPADISGARSQFLAVSNLVKGQYSFLLKVTDEAGQSDEDDVKVYVKPPTNLPPVVSAGSDQALSLPLPFLTLDGSQSHDDGNITKFSWSLVSAPSGAGAPVIHSPGAAVTNVTSLGVGSYTFKLTVEDNSGNSASDAVEVTVTQDTNTAPVADPGPGLKLILPHNQAGLDGSRSSDDLAVTRWAWTRDPDSLAAGTVIGNMSSPRLVIAELVAGKYSFNLQVWDEQGLTSNKSVQVTVSQDPDRLNIVEIVLNKNLSHFTQAQKQNVLGRIQLLAEGKGELSVGEVHLASHRSELATLHFKVFSASGGISKSLPGGR